MRSYDQKQLAAVLRRCLGCGQWFYFTDPYVFRCAGCRQ